ncbi:hypothetical protein CKO28_14370 [Rhodovibrio sodomensis]|uniref:Uncharacterized protein n=1 Tax=Rhodovibrio sodomensis TaxID=1088 RepID=A0ABS1DFH1_9PROT|nr:hypothetical protein [Rhodovibrio sodomensis]MBK1669219.1 hypothetical protein [Rhodovibrio sodomensis]
MDSQKAAVGVGSVMGLSFGGISVYALSNLQTIASEGLAQAGFFSAAFLVEALEAIEDFIKHAVLSYVVSEDVAAWILTGLEWMLVAAASWKIARWTFALGTRASAMAFGVED